MESPRESLDFSDGASQHTARASLSRTNSLGNVMVRSQSRLSASTSAAFTDAHSTLEPQQHPDPAEQLNDSPKQQTSQQQEEEEDLTERTHVQRERLEAETVQDSVPPVLPNPVLPIAPTPAQANPIRHSTVTEKHSSSVSDKTVAASTGRKSQDGKDSSSVEIPDGPDLSHLTPEQRKILIEQSELPKSRKAGIFELFRFSTTFENLSRLVGLLCAIVTGVVQPLMTVVFGDLTNAFTKYYSLVLNGASAAEFDAACDDLFSRVNTNVLYLVYIAIAMFVTAFVSEYTWVLSAETTCKQIREKYFESVLRQNIGFFDALGAGEVATRIESDCHLVQDGIGDKIPISVQFIATFVAAFVIAYIRQWLLALALSSVVPCIVIAGAIMTKFETKYKVSQLNWTSQGGNLAEECISSIRTVVAFGNQHVFADKYDVVNEKTQTLGVKMAGFHSAGIGVFFFLIYSVYALGFYFGTTLLLDGRASSGDIITVFFSILIGAFSLAQLAPNLQALSAALGAVSKLYDQIDRIPPIDSSSDEGQKPAIHGNISVKNLTFYYPTRPGVRVLDNVSIEFKQGETTALVGGSGSGKSTIIGLLERWYRAVEGDIYVDGVNVEDLNVKHLRRAIGLVSQDAVVFKGSVYENIAYGLIGTPHEFADEEVKRKMVVQAAIEANADSFVRTLDQGYDTNVGERGALLSGGQKQRVCIARAIVKDPPILMLDEATSALDSTSERIVQDALDKASRGRTTIAIAHRLSTIKDAAKIVVLSGGVVLEEGSHHDLLADPEGPYSKLVAAQKLKEEVAEDGSSNAEENPEDLLAQEKEDLGDELKRAGTSRSAASIALSHRLKAAANAPESNAGILPLFFRIGRLNKGQALSYTLGCIAAVFSGVVYPVFGIVFGRILSAYSSPDRGHIRSAGNNNGLYMFIIAIIATIAIFVQNRAFARSAEYLSRRVRLLAFSTLLRQDVAYFDLDNHSTGSLVASIADWAQKINALYGVTLGVILQSIVTLIAGMIIGIVYSWKIGLVGTACIPLAVSTGFVRLRVVVLADKKTKQLHEKSAQLACEGAAAIRTMVSLTREEEALRAYSHALEEPLVKTRKSSIGSNLAYAVSQALSFLIIALIFWFGSHELVDSGLTTQAFFTCLISIVFASIQAGNVFNFVPDVSSSTQAAGALANLMDEQPELDAEDPSGAPVQTTNGDLAFRNVHFRYQNRPETRVLRGLNLTVKPGQFAAIVGPSGSGKSTVIQLICRFYDPLSGRLELDGRNITELNLSQYRSQIALVSQEPTLYSGTVRDNISLGSSKPASEVTEEEVIKACKDANIWTFVESLPEGLDTEVGGKGGQLSGGQKQRIAIARALVRNPKILLLDEATSALDSESERVVQTALDAAAKGRTTIAVAHRLSTIQRADIIYVVSEGRVVEQGSHSELVAKGGLYNDLVAQQGLQRD